MLSSLETHSPEDRRRHHRPEGVSRESLERTLGSWRGLADAWNSISDLAKEVKNQERQALAEAKLAQCQSEIERLEELLGSAFP